MPELIRHFFARPGEQAWLRVDSAATRAIVYLNQVEVARHLGPWTPFEVDLSSHMRNENVLEIHCDSVSPGEYPFSGFLPTIGIESCGVSDFHILQEPTAPRVAAPPRARCDGDVLLVDDQPLRVRGILHWGYYPELGHCWPTERSMRDELSRVKARGFNLVKFASWIPPRRFYELCDEYELLVWQEYPLWNTPLDDQKWIQEYDRFFENDASHSCIVLRSLTCENEGLEPELAAKIIGKGRKRIPGALFLDNSSWTGTEAHGDVHDEHLYLHRLQWPYQALRLEGQLTKPLLIGESLCVDSTDMRSRHLSVEIRRSQIEQIESQFPNAGYVVTAIRDLAEVPLGILDRFGKPKDSVEEWRWHGKLTGRKPRSVPPKLGAIPGPHKGEWKCRENTFWSPTIKVLDPFLPRRLIEEEALFDLFTGRVLQPYEGARVLVELWDVHSGLLRIHPLVLEYCTGGQHHIVSAFRTDTAIGRELEALLRSKRSTPPEVGPIHGDAVVLEDWLLLPDTRRPGEPAGEKAVKCDTPFVNDGDNLFYGWATFRTWLDHPGGPWLLCCESVGDYYEISIDGEYLGQAGDPVSTRGGTRDKARQFLLDRVAGRYELVFRVRDWRGAGGMVGPVYLTQDPGLPVL